MFIFQLCSFFYVVLSLWGEICFSSEDMVVYVFIYKYIYHHILRNNDFSQQFFCLKICKYPENEYICTVSEGVSRRFWLNLFKFVTKSLPKKKTSLQDLDYNGVVALSFKSLSLRKGGLTKNP